jgi:hypothetical protein
VLFVFAQTALVADFSENSRDFFFHSLSLGGIGHLSSRKPGEKLLLVVVFPTSLARISAR